MSDNLVDQLSIGAAMGNGKADSDMHIHDVMMTPIVDSFKKMRQYRATPLQFTDCL